MQFHLSILFVCAAALSGCGRQAPSSMPEKSSTSTHAQASVGFVRAKRAGESKSTSEEVLDAARLTEITKIVMAEQYGDRFDFDRNCWNFSVEMNDVQRDYCMTPAQPRLVQLGGETRVFLYAFNRSDMGASGSPYSYGATEPGVMGAFALRLNPTGHATYIASERALQFGTAGDCGCREARFVRLDSGSTYGWLFASGGIWQGTLVSNYSIVAPVGGKFVDLSAIPDVTEDDQGATHVIEVEATGGASGLYPLRVTKQRNGKKEQEFLIEFDRARGTYSLPRDR